MYIVFMQYDEHGAAVGISMAREGDVELEERAEGYKVNATDLPNGTKAGRAVVFGTISADPAATATIPAPRRR